MFLIEWKALKTWLHFKDSDGMGDGVEEFYTQGGAINSVVFSWSQQASDKIGYAIGRENLEVRVPVLDARQLGWNSTPYKAWGIDLLNIPGATVKIQHPSVQKNPNYCPPDEDFVWQEFEAWIEGVWQELQKCEKRFCEEDGSWNLHFPDGGAPAEMYRIETNSIKEETKNE